MRTRQGNGRMSLRRTAAVAWLGILIGIAGGAAAPVVGQDQPLEPRHTMRPAGFSPVVDVEALRELGIFRYESQRLVLYSDIDPEIAKTLPPLIDAAYVAWNRYFGSLPPAADGSEFQLTGCLMKNRRLFLEAGLLPDDLLDFEHGRHRGYRFWMNEQAFDYYRRHLLIHEATHCYMLILPEFRRPPLFYLEGMAEFFGTHRIDEKGQIHFGIIPEDPQQAIGFGRIEMIRQAVAEGRAKSLEGVLGLDATDFTVSRSEPYAWSWALCKFLDTHPKTRDDFRRLAPITEGIEFRRRFEELLEKNRPALDIEWELFSQTLEYGHDIERAAIDFRPGEKLPPGGNLSVSVDADRGWQCTSLQVEAGQTYRLTAEGQVTLADEPRPWVSEPQGITIRYSAGRPIGRLLAGILRTGSTDPEDTDKTGQVERMQVIDVGRTSEITATVTGTLYLRVNDFWGRLHDNHDAYRVNIESIN